MLFRSIHVSFYSKHFYQKPSSLPILVISYPFLPPPSKLFLIFPQFFTFYNINLLHPSNRCIRWSTSYVAKYRKRFSLILSSIGATLTRLRISLFLTLSIIVLPHIYLNIHISATLIFCVCCFLLAQHSVPYNKEGLTAVL